MACHSIQHRNGTRERHKAAEARMMFERYDPHARVPLTGAEILCVVTAWLVVAAFAVIVVGGLYNQLTNILQRPT